MMLSFKICVISVALAVMSGTAMRKTLSLEDFDTLADGHLASSEIEEQLTSRETPEELHSMWRKVQKIENPMMKGSKEMKVKKAVGKLSEEELEVALELADDSGWKNVVQGKLNKKRKDKEKELAYIAGSRGADEDTKEAERAKQRAKWSWAGTPGQECVAGENCHGALTCSQNPDLQVTFVKTNNFHDTLPKLSEGFDAAKTMLAFDMDGTLAYMKENFGKDTVKTLTEAPGMSKVVITARGNRNVIGCNTVLQTLVGQHGVVNQKADGGFDCKGTEGCSIKTLFGLPDQCVEEEHRMDIEPRKTTNMLAMQGLVMPEYDKAGGLATYVNSNRKFVDQKPEHLIFYDDFVTNPVNMAEHFCFWGKGWIGLKKVTAVWYATPEAEQRDVTIAKRVMSGEVTPDKHSEGSFFAPAADNDAALAGQRALFGLN